MCPCQVQKQKDKKRVIFRLFILLLLSLRLGGEGCLTHKSELYDVPIVDGRYSDSYGTGIGVGQNSLPIQTYQLIFVDHLLHDQYLLLKPLIPLRER